MKCDTCVFMRVVIDLEYGMSMPHAFCAKHLWEGIGNPNELDTWAECRLHWPKYSVWMTEIESILADKKVCIENIPEMHKYMKMYYDMNFSADAAVFSEFKI